MVSELGEIRWTKQRITKEIVENSENTIFLFGDNDIDKTRPEGINREYIGGKTLFKNFSSVIKSRRKNSFMSSHFESLPVTQE